MEVDALTRENGKNTRDKGKSGGKDAGETRVKGKEKSQTAVPPVDGCYTCGGKRWARDCWRSPANKGSWCNPANKGKSKNKGTDKGSWKGRGKNANEIAAEPWDSETWDTKAWDTESRYSAATSAAVAPTEASTAAPSARAMLVPPAEQQKDADGKYIFAILDSSSPPTEERCEWWTPCRCKERWRRSGRECRSWVRYNYAHPAATPLCTFCSQG